MWPLRLKALYTTAPPNILHHQYIGLFSLFEAVPWLQPAQFRKLAGHRLSLPNVMLSLSIITKINAPGMQPMSNALLCETTDVPQLVTFVLNASAILGPLRYFDLK